MVPVEGEEPQPVTLQAKDSQGLRPPPPQLKTKTPGTPFGQDAPPTPRQTAAWSLPDPAPAPLGSRGPNPRYSRALVQPCSPSTSRRSPKPARTAPARPRGGLSLVLSSVNMGPKDSGPEHTPLAGRKAAGVAGGERAPLPRPSRPRA